MYNERKIILNKTVAATAEDFIGLSKRQGQDLAEARNMIFQLVRINDEKFFEYPTDPNTFRFDRVYVELDNGKISIAKII